MKEPSMEPMRPGDAYWPLVSALWEKLSILHTPDRFVTEFAAAPIPGRTLLAAHWCQSEVCNGGFYQFFYNSTGILAPEAASAFQSLGMPRSADVIKRAMDWFGETYPRNRRERLEKLKEHIVKTQFRSLDNEFYQLYSSENGGFLHAADVYATAQGSH